MHVAVRHAARYVGWTLLIGVTTLLLLGPFGPWIGVASGLLSVVALFYEVSLLVERQLAEDAHHVPVTALLDSD
jgi:uncharacterized membrane protein YkgB